MSNNLVLAAAIGYKFEQIEFFVKSLRKFYNDKIVFLINDKDKDLKNKLVKFDCKTLITKINKKEIQFNLESHLLVELHELEAYGFPKILKAFHKSEDFLKI